MAIRETPERDGARRKRLSELEPAARDRFLDGAEAAMRGGSHPRAPRPRRGAGYHIPTPVAFVFMFFIGVGAAGATLYWMGAVNTARETSLTAQLLASQAEVVASKEKLNRQEAERLAVEAEKLAAATAEEQAKIRDIILRYTERAKQLDRESIADEPEEAILTIWLLRQMLAVAAADAEESLELQQRYEHSRDSVIREIIEMIYPDLPLEDALRSIERSVPEREELYSGNSG